MVSHFKKYLAFYGSHHFRRYKAVIALAFSLVFILCGFSLTDIIFKGFTLDDYVQVDLITDGSALMCDEIGDSLRAGIDYNSFKEEIKNHMDLSDFEVEIKPFEEPWIVKFLQFLVDIVT